MIFKLCVLLIMIVLRNIRSILRQVKYLHLAIFSPKVMMKVHIPRFTGIWRIHPFDEQELRPIRIKISKSNSQFDWLLAGCYIQIRQMGVFTKCL
ncbi:hypothetical protein DFP73DRAFT_379730 [Morchella snyderi]|nr:hypothetical protein DFP73DRAFT_379730 [Morchella snyderi]